MFDVHISLVIIHNIAFDVVISPKIYYDQIIMNAFEKFISPKIYYINNILNNTILLSTQYKLCNQ